MTIKSYYGVVKSVECDDCNLLVPFTQPELSRRVSDVIIHPHACPAQALAERRQEVADELSLAQQEAAIIAAQQVAATQEPAQPLPPPDPIPE